MVEEARRGKPGPKPNPNRGAQAGYRISDRRRYELQMAALFVGTSSLQETLDVAVGEFLERVHGLPGFDAALNAAEGAQRSRADVPVIGSD